MRPTAISTNKTITSQPRKESIATEHQNSSFIISEIRHVNEMGGERLIPDRCSISDIQFLRIYKMHFIEQLKFYAVVAVTDRRQVPHVAGKA